LTLTDFEGVGLLVYGRQKTVGARAGLLMTSIGYRLKMMNYI
jgi:hypothetical protein